MHTISVVILQSPKIRSPHTAYSERSLKWGEGQGVMRTLGPQDAASAIEFLDMNH